ASFLYFAVRRREAFEEVFLGALLFQALGALAYLLAPALGPFVRERGANAVVSGVQQTMLGVHRSVSAEGPAWLATHASDHLTAGVAAMPSLHV
ncbi:MAG: phosphatase PAP2 family protein, partial [Alphaproteobacteria bacterium]